MNVAEQGVALYNAGKFEDAVKWFESAVENGSHDAATRRFLAHAYASMGRTDEAVRQLREAFRLGSDPSAVYDGLRMIIGEAARFGEVEESLKIAAEKMGGMRLILGGLYFEQGRFQDAEKHLEEAILVEGESQQARILLGRVLEALGRVKEAEATYLEAVRLHPKSTDCRLRLGEFYLSTNRWEEAQAQLHDAVRLNGKHASGYLLLGRALEGAGRSEEAEKAFRAAYKLNAKDSEPSLRLGEFCLHHGRLDEAEGLLVEAAGKSTATPAGCLLLAELLIGRDKLKEAETYLREGEKRWPHEAKLSAKLGWLYQQLDEPENLKMSFARYLRSDSKDYPHRFMAAVAIEDYEGAIAEGEKALDSGGAEIDDRFFHPWADDWFPPRSPSFYEDQLLQIGALGRKLPGSPWPAFFRGLLLGHLKRYRESLSVFDSLEESSRNRYGWMGYASGLYRLLLCDYESAIEDFRASLESRPDVWMTRCHLAEAYLCSGDTTRAFLEFDAAERLYAGEPAPEVWAWRGECLLWIGMYEAAERELTRALDAGSSFAGTWRGAARMLAGDPVGALADLDRAAAGGAPDPEAALWRGELLRRMGRHEEALKELDMSVEGGGLAWARVNRALTCAELGRFDEMWSDFEALPKDIAGVEGARGLDARGVVKILESALVAARGVRRPERYTWAALRSGRSEGPEIKMEGVKIAMPAPTVESVGFLEKADKLSGEGKLLEAAASLEEARATMPRSSEILFKLGWIYDQAGEKNQMRATYNDFLQSGAGAHPLGHFLAWIGLGEYERAFAVAENLLDDWDGAADYARLFQPWADHWMYPRSNRAYEQIELKLSLLSSRLAGNPWISLYRGQCLARLNRSAEALHSLDALREVSGQRYGWMRFATGGVRLGAGRYLGALDDFKAALRSRPKAWWARCRLAEALLCLGRDEEAFKQFDRAQSSAKDVSVRANIRAWRGEGLLWVGRYEDALVDLDCASADGAWLAGCWSGGARMLLGRSEEALVDLDAAIVAGSRDAEAFVWRGELRRRMADLSGSLCDLDRAVELQGGTWALVNRALTHAALGDRGAMLKDAKRIPPAVLACGLKNVKGEADRVVGSLESALAQARGVRRYEEYLTPIWMKGVEPSAAWASVQGAQPYGV